MHLRTLLPCLLPLALLGCEEWPRFANPPADASLPGDVDPRAMVSDEFGWGRALLSCKELPDTLEEFQADSNNWRPTARSGHHLYSRLLGGGSADGGPFIEENPCAEPWNKGLNGRRYTGDVDLIRVQVPVGDTLCVSAYVPDMPSGYNLDVRAFRADNDCQLPTGSALTDPSTDPPTQLGLGSDDLVEWSLTTDVEYYILMVAAFKGVSNDEYVNYHLGLSVVPSASDGTPGICPYLSEDTKERVERDAEECDDPSENADPTEGDP